jgi:hypothetical protein
MLGTPSRPFFCQNEGEMKVGRQKWVKNGRRGEETLHEGGIITFFFFGFDDILPSSGISLGCFF